MKFQFLICIILSWVVQISPAFSQSNPQIIPQNNSQSDSKLNSNTNSSDSVSVGSKTSLPAPCKLRPLSEQIPCRDSILLSQKIPTKNDTLARSLDSLVNDSTEDNSLDNIKDSERKGNFKVTHKNSEAEADADATDERASGYFVGLFGGSGKGDSKNKKESEVNNDAAKLIFVFAGVIVVGAFIFYGGKALYDLIVNPDDQKVFHEVGLRYSYSGETWQGGGPSLYRNSNLIGLRYATGLDQGGWSLGLAAEGGYIDLNLYDPAGSSPTYDFHGGYFLFGPLVRFGENDPYSFTVEFLNGSSNQLSIGWIHKSRLTLQRRLGPSPFIAGAHLGAVFYDLNFADGLIQRSGDFNRDLSMIYGLDMSWEF